MLLMLTNDSTQKLRFLVGGQLQNQCGDALLFVFSNLFLPHRERRDTCIHGYWNQTKFPIHMVAKRGRTNRTYPYVKKSFKTQHGRIPINRAILTAIGQKK